VIEDQKTPTAVAQRARNTTVEKTLSFLSRLNRFLGLGLEEEEVVLL
jgi:hypothetical protein